MKKYIEEEEKPELRNRGGRGERDSSGSFFIEFLARKQRSLPALVIHQFRYTVKYTGFKKWPLFWLVISGIPGQEGRRSSGICFGIIIKESRQGTNMTFPLPLLDTLWL